MDNDGALVPAIHECVRRHGCTAAGARHVYEQRDRPAHGRRPALRTEPGGAGPVARPLVRGRAGRRRARAPRAPQAPPHHQPAVRGELPARTRGRALRLHRLL